MGQTLCQTCYLILSGPARWGVLSGPHFKVLKNRGSEGLSGDLLSPNLQVKCEIGIFIVVGSHPCL